jgi:hypothetical protein
MRRLFVTVLVLATAGFAGCGERNVPERELNRALDRTEKESREFVYREQVEYEPPRAETEVRRARPEILDQSNEVTGRVEDDLRFALTYSGSGTPIAEAVVSDDALAARIIDVQAALSNNRQAVERLGAIGGSAEDPEAFRALLDGRWVIDYKAAPPLALAVTQEGEIEVGRNPAQDAILAFQYFRRAIEEAAGVVEFNPDGIEYNPADDPWSDDKDKDLRAKGIRRYDLIAPGLPRRGQASGQSRDPGTPHFRKMAFYVRGDRVLKVVEKIDIEGQRDFRRILDQDRGSDYHRDMLKRALEGGTRDLVRERSMSYEVARLGQAVTVQLPVADSIVGSVGLLLGGDPGTITPFAAPQGRTPEPVAVEGPDPGSEEAEEADAAEQDAV